MKVRALSNINSGQYAAGDEFDIDDSSADQLIEAGAAEAVDPSSAKVADAEAPATADPLVSGSPVDGDIQPPESKPAIQEATPPQKSEPKQPTEAQIAATLAASETPLDESQDLHIS